MITAAEILGFAKKIMDGPYALDFISSVMGATKILAKAIITEERERCAKAVESFVVDIDGWTSTEDRALIASINVALESAAAKIRSGK